VLAGMVADESLLAINQALVGWLAGAVSELPDGVLSGYY
jgi:hypothetical protein